MARAGEKKRSPIQRKKLAEQLRAAHAGAPPVSWLHDLVVNAGYIRHPVGTAVLVNFKQLEAVLDLSERAVRSLISAGLPCAQPGRGRTPALFDIVKVLDWRREREAQEDPLLRGVKSQAQEELRAEMVRKVRRENELAEEQLVEKTVVRDELETIARVFRERAEQVGRIHGIEVANAVTMMINEAEKAWRERVIKTPAADLLQPSPTPAPGPLVPVERSA